MRKLLHTEHLHRMASFCLPLTTWPNRMTSLPFPQGECEIMDKALQLWTELLNLSDTNSLPQVSFGQDQLSAYACGRRRFTGLAKGIGNFWCSAHVSGVVLAGVVLAGPAYQLHLAPAEGQCTAACLQHPKTDLGNGPSWWGGPNRSDIPAARISMAWDKSQGVMVQAESGQFGAARFCFPAGQVRTLLLATPSHGITELLALESLRSSWPDQRDGSWDFIQDFKKALD